MTLAEYKTFQTSVRTKLVSILRDVLPDDEDSGCSIIFHHAASNVTSEDQWLASLRKDNGLIRLLAVLPNQLNSNELPRMAGAKTFSPFLSFSLELLHSLSPGNGLESDQTFYEDILSIQFALDTNRNFSIQTFSNHVTIENYSLRPGIRPSKIQPLHYARGEVKLGFREIRY